MLRLLFPNSIDDTFYREYDRYKYKPLTRVPGPSDLLGGKREDSNWISISHDEYNNYVSCKTAISLSSQSIWRVVFQ